MLVYRAIASCFKGEVSLQLGMQGRCSGREEASGLRLAVQVGGNSCPLSYCFLERLENCKFIQNAYV